MSEALILATALWQEAEAELVKAQAVEKAAYDVTELVDAPAVAAYFAAEKGKRKPFSLALKSSPTRAAWYVASELTMVRAQISERARQIVVELSSASKGEDLI